MRCMRELGFGSAFFILLFVSFPGEVSAMARGRYSDDVGDRALDVAVQTCDYENAKIILHRGADPDATVAHEDRSLYPSILGWAILSGCPDVVQLLLDNGASVLKRHPAAEDKTVPSTPVFNSAIWLRGLPLEQAVAALSMSSRSADGRLLDRWKVVDLILKAGARRLGSATKLVHLDSAAAIKRANTLEKSLRRKALERLGV